MLYSKPTNVSYTDMAKFFDSNFFTKDRNDTLCHKYLYLLYYMLACKNKYFTKFEDYNKFSIFASNLIYIRFLKKYRNGEKVKSVLNYAKSTLYPIKVMYLNDEFKENGDIKKKGGFVVDTMKQHIQDEYSKDISEEVIETLQSIPMIIKDVLSTTPYKEGTLDYRRIYISCLITLLKSITLSKSNQEKCKMKGEKLKDKHLIKMYNEELINSTTSWRLNNSMKDYIDIVITKIKERLVEEIEDTRKSYSLDTATLNAILSSAWETSTHNTNDMDEI